MVKRRKGESFESYVHRRMFGTKPKGVLLEPSLKGLDKPKRLK